MADTKTRLTRLAGRTLARLIGHVAKTSQIVYDPPDLLDRLAATHPCTVACWHGQFMMLCLLRPPGAKVSAMVARHGDAELIGEAMRAFDVELIRGAGAGDRKRDRGGAAALRGAVRALTQGASVVMTADVPPGPARTAGMGIITIAQLSGRPIAPVAAASSRMTSFDTWSRITVNLPYSKLAFAGGEIIHVPRDADAATLEQLRKKLEDELNTAMTRAYALAGAELERATPLDMIAARSPPAPGRTLRIYTKGIGALRPLVPVLLNYRARRDKEDSARRNERLGAPTMPRPKGKLVWVHAASVGETNVALPVIEAMLARDDKLHILLTTGTTTSAALAAKRLPDRAFHQFVPLDVGSYVAGFLDHWKPDFAIFTESEIWPNLILAASERKIPLALINARMSPRSMRRWRAYARVGRPLFSRFSLILAQNERVARALRFLGAPNVVTSGNLKIDAPPPPVDAVQLEALKQAVGMRPVWLAASTHPGEEQMIAAAHVQLAAQLPTVLTIIVPRHPDRAEAIINGLAPLGLKVERRSETKVPSADGQIFIADTIGELGTFYALSPLAYIGGSLVPHGGQNPIEAVKHGAAVISGPHTHNFQEAYAALSRSNGVITITSAQGLADVVSQMLSNPGEMSAARQAAETGLAELAGAMKTTMDALTPYLDGQETARREH
ncbi:MAG: glycosyltransferase N-terminal domain-containing protein [Hyphomicrobiaceae bacterium]